MQKLTELMVWDEPFAVLAKVQFDKVAVAVELDLVVQSRMGDNLFELL